MARTGGGWPIRKDSLLGPVSAVSLVGFGEFGISPRPRVTV